MSLGGSKPKKAKAHQYKSSYNNVSGAQFDSDFGSGSSREVGGTLTTTGSLAPGLQGVKTQATQAAENNLGYLNRDPVQRINFLRDGGDPGYNLLKEQQDRAVQEAIGRSQINSFSGGRSNSTTAGAALGSIYNDDIIRRNQLLSDSLTRLDTRAERGAQIGMGTLGQLNNFVTPLMSGANANLITAYNQRDAAAARNAAARNAAELQNVQAQNAYRQQKSAAWGNALGQLAGTGTQLALGAAGVPFGAAAAMPPGGGGMPQQPYQPALPNVSLPQPQVFGRSLTPFNNNPYLMDVA